MSKWADLSIIIPTLRQWGYYEKIIENLFDLWYWDAEIITIEGETVNKAWNMWVEKATRRYVLIINDDIVIKGNTIEILKELLVYYRVACPWFTAKDSDVWNWWVLNNICWFCFMFERKNADLFFPIPEELVLWYGDNWIFERVQRKIWRGGRIHHHESSTILNEENKKRCMELVEKDKLAREKILQSNKF